MLMQSAVHIAAGVFGMCNDFLKEKLVVYITSIKNIDVPTRLYHPQERPALHTSFHTGQCWIFLNCLHIFGSVITS